MSPFLFSIDLEEFMPARAGMSFRRTALPQLTECYLEFLRRHEMKATFFVVGEVARHFPTLIREIEAEGHELGCHTNTHQPLTGHIPDSLREDLQRNLEAVRHCVSSPVTGFRAPVLSLTEETSWVYEILAELGFLYSSSVLSAPNPLHGWPSFGAAPRTVNGILELPVTLSDFVGMRIPIAAGTYFRCLPFGAIRRAFAKCTSAGNPIIGYFHPYDIDTSQQWVMNSGVRGNPLLNAMLYINRSHTLRRLESIVSAGYPIMTYHEYFFTRR